MKLVKEKIQKKQANQKIGISKGFQLQDKRAINEDPQNYLVVDVFINPKTLSKEIKISSQVKFISNINIPVKLVFILWYNNGFKSAQKPDVLDGIANVNSEVGNKNVI